jgi:hypothetical protein
LRETGEQIKVLWDGSMRPITNGDEATRHSRTRGVIEAAVARARDAPRTASVLFAARASHGIGGGEC